MTAEQKEIVKKAKAGTWYEGWTPYCLKCSTTERMVEFQHGFRCVACNNHINWDLTHYDGPKEDMVVASYSERGNHSIMEAPVNGCRCGLCIALRYAEERSTKPK